MVNFDNKIFNRVLVIDGSYALHRSLHISELFQLRGPSGERSGGIFGFLRMFNKEIKKYPQHFPVVCFDEGLDPRRVKAYPHYKHADERADKSKMVMSPEELDDDYLTQYKKQRNALAIILQYFGVPVLKFMPWEGDDLMYYVSKASNDSVVLTDDRDLLQLLSENCIVRRPMADEVWTLDSFLESKGYSEIYDFVMEKAVLGDASDNIPGSCKGVGGGTAPDFIKLLRHFKTEGQFDFSDYPASEQDMKNLCNDIGVKYRKAFLNFDCDKFFVNLELVDLDKVVVPDNISESINSTIANCKNISNYFKAVQSMNNYGIREVPVDEIIQEISIRYKYLEDNNE